MCSGQSHGGTCQLCCGHDHGGCCFLGHGSGVKLVSGCHMGETADCCAQVLHVPSFIPASMEQVCDIISKQPGIEALRLGRQVGS